jgi:YHS domain-containing protein
MRNIYLKTALAGAIALAMSTAAFAVTGEFKNMCSWGLANHKNVQTDCTVNSSIKGKTYCFSSEQAKADFMKNPDANLAKAGSFYNSEHQG